ncbi:MAG: lipopolysaccharide biosynthesis protein [Actinobacteria bacterium]|nr:lipopolysaccharide biosynthesis protein [Actinomycetota bacterium]
MRRKVIRGLIWTSLSFGVWKAISFIAVLVLARLLQPRDFGLVGIAMIAIGVIRMFQDMGVGSALVFRKDCPERLTSTAFYMVLASGLIFTLASYFSADPIALYFKNRDAAPILKVLSFAILPISIGTIPSVLLNKELRFRKKAIPDTAGALIQAVVSIALALMGYGVWSLVFGELANRIVNAVLLWLVSPWRPKLVFDVESARTLFSYGKFMTGSSIVSFATSNADNAVTARMLGASALGYYSLAFRIASLPSTLTFFIVSKITFPFFSKLQDDVGKLSEAFLKTLRCLAFISLSAAVLMYMLAPELLGLLLGAKWGSSVAPLRGLVAYGVLSSFILQAIEVFKATGRPQISFRAESIRLLILIPLAIGGATYHGIVGIAVAQSLTVAAAAAFYFRPALRILEIRLRDVSAALLPAALPAISVALVLALLRLALPIQTSAVAYLGASLFAAGAAFAASSVLLARRSIANWAKRSLPNWRIAEMLSALGARKG